MMQGGNELLASAMCKKLRKKKAAAKLHVFYCSF